MIIEFDALSLLLYITNAILGYLCIVLSKKWAYKKGKNVSVFSRYYMFWILCWSILGALRLVNEYGVGGMDSRMYIDCFEKCENISNMLAYPHIDIGFKIFTFLIRQISSSYHFFFFVCEMIITMAYAYAVKELSNNKSTSIPYVLIFFVFLRGFNTLRTSMSIAMILVATVLLFKQKYIKSFIIFTISVTFHKASFIYALLYIFQIVYMKKKITVKESFILIIFGFVLATIAQKMLLGNFGASLGGAYSYYAGISNSASFFEGYWKIAFEQILLGIAMFFNRKTFSYRLQFLSDKERNREKFIWNACIFDLMMIPITYKISLWRGYEYLYLLRLIMWSECIDLFLIKIRMKDRQFVKMILFAIFLIWLIWRLIATYSDAGLMPYRLYFL